MAVLTVRQVIRTGLVKTAGEAASAGGDTLPNDGKTELVVINGGGSACVVTIDAVANCNQGFDHNAGGSVAAGATTAFGPFPTNQFGTQIAVTYDQVTTVTVECRRV